MDNLYHLYHDLFQPEIIYLCLKARCPCWQNKAQKTLENTDISKFLGCFVLVTVYIFINLHLNVSFYLNTSILSQVYNYVADSIFLSLFCKDNTIKAANTIKDVKYGNGRSVFTEIFQNISGCRFKGFTLKLKVFLFFLSCLANFAFISRSLKSHWQNPTQVLITSYNSVLQN